MSHSSTHPRIPCATVATVTLLAIALPLTIVTAEDRTIDGTNNNLEHPEWGAAGTPLRRVAPADYPDDGSGETMLNDADRANARDVSNAVADQGDLVIDNDLDLSGFAWQWGQFLDHDIDLTHTGEQYGTATILTSPDDPWFAGTPIFMTRSAFADGTGLSGENPRQQVNSITAYVDASNVYGSDAVTAAALRTFEGGKLAARVIDGLEYLPVDADGNVMAGDVRAAEQIGLTAMHTLFMREHNRLADRYAALHPEADDEEIYQAARRIVGAEIQIITYREFLPALLGRRAPRAEDYRYNPRLDASIANTFSTALYRVGHTMLPSTLELVDADGASAGAITLRDAFFNPSLLESDGRLDQILRGLAADHSQEIDPFVVDDVRNFLFGTPGDGGFDLVSLNIQRGRDHGLPDYNTLRRAHGLRPVASLADIASDSDVRDRLAAVYDDVNNIDAWVGALAEDHGPDAAVGQLIAAGLAEQFCRLRDGDRFFYVGDRMLRSARFRGVIDLKSVTLARIIRDNSGADQIGRDAFTVSAERRTRDRANDDDGRRNEPLRVWVPRRSPEFLRTQAERHLR